MPAYCKRCALHIPDGMSSCRMCGSSVLSAPPELVHNALIGAERATVPVEREFSKWLLCVGLSLIVAPALCVYAIVYDEIPALFSDEGRTLILEHPGLDRLFSFEICMNLVLVMAALALNVFFYTRNRYFPKAMVVFLVITFASRVAVAGFTHSLFPNEVLTHSAYELVRYLAGCGTLAAFLLLNPNVESRFQN